MFRRLAVLAATAALAVTGTAVPARAATTACTATAGGPRCQVWTGTVDWVPDGDTLRVHLDGGKATSQISVRVLGIQAMEQHVYSPKPERRRGDCHALAATARVEKLVKAGGNRVRLTSLKAASVSGSRPLRSVAVKIGGKWTDIGQDLVRGGHALWLPFPGEWAMDGIYHAAAKQAAAAGRGLYDTDACKPGPAQNSGLTLTVNPDAEGDDAQNLNGEWFKIHNPSAAAVPVAGWWVRDSALRRYTFPAGTVVAPGGDLYVHVGTGRDTATRKYWGLTQPILSNADPANHSVGDGGYLFDPHGDLRSWMIYP
ncbi:lamin tail domain-containing protein [Actinoplanes sp. G11-F43]|uniref:lamin tail domain-containing protein n=1 Tax=Actinoplanes sp. G11-F43 TaxID=3424130 RepID=UPI003D33DC5F